MRLMAKIGATISVISGIVVIIGAFLPWIKEGSMSVSGWDMTTWGYFYVGLHLVAYMYIFATYIVVGGGIFMAICAIPVWLEAFLPRGGRTYKVMLFLVIFGAMVAIGGCIWSMLRLIDIKDEFSAAGFHAGICYGFYITAVAAVTGLISTILTSFSLKEKFFIKFQNRTMINGIKCPICGSETSLRVVKKGSDIGKGFNVCNRYPVCQGRVQVRKSVS